MSEVPLYSAGRSDTSSPLRGGRGSFPIAWTCTPRNRIPASAMTSQGPTKGDLILPPGLVGGDYIHAKRRQLREPSFLFVLPLVSHPLPALHKRRAATFDRFEI